MDTEYQKQPLEQGYLASQARIDPIWHMSESMAAAASGDWFAACFHYGWSLEADVGTPGAMELRRLSEYAQKLSEEKPKAPALLPGQIRRLLEKVPPVDSDER